MATGYKTVDPMGWSTVIKAEMPDQLREKVRSLIDRWNDYCDRNWLNDTDDLFSPEEKVKRFLDRLAYIWMVGHTDGIETDYKHVMRAKREIPESSCPSYIENILYASGSADGATAQREETDRFRTMTDALDERAKPYEGKKRPQIPRRKSKFQKLLKMRIAHGEWLAVDTEGEFTYHGRRYRIDEGEQQYQPVYTKYGKLYDMDRVMAAETEDGGMIFLDMNYDIIRVNEI